MEDQKDKPSGRQARRVAGATAAGRRPRGGGRGRRAAWRVGRWFAKDPLNTLLIVASIGLVVSLLQPARRDPAELRAANGCRSARSPSSPSTSRSRRRPCSTRTRASSSTPRKASSSTPPIRSPTRRPHRLLKQLTASGAVVEIDQQADKPSKQIIVQFLIPILLLVCLFVLFTRLGAGRRRRRLRRLLEVHRQGPQDGRATRRTAPPSTTSPAPARRSPSCARSATTSPTRASTRRSGRGRPKGVLLVGPPGTGKTLLAKATAGRGRRGLLLALGLGLRRVAGRGRRGARPRPLRQGAQDGAGARSSSTSSTPPGASAAPASARATTSASRR